MRSSFLFACFLLLAGQQAFIQAGVYTILEQNNPLPSNWRGFLPDQRQLRLAAVDPAIKPGTTISTLRDRYQDYILTTEGKVRSADQAADLSAAYIRIGQPEKAVSLLRSAKRNFPEDYRLPAHLGTAYQMIGELELSEETLKESVKLSPEKNKRAEEFHLKLVKLRFREGKKAADHVDLLWDAEKPPEDAIAIVQQLALWLPADGRLLWLLAELAHEKNDSRTAANILDGCASEFGMNSQKLRERRQLFRETVDKLEKNNAHTSKQSNITFASSRPLGSTFDASKLPPIRDDRANPLPWTALIETSIGKGFKPTFHKHVESLADKPVTLHGYAAKSGDDESGVMFLMTEYPIGCWFCESPEPTSIIRVELANPVEHSKIAKGALIVSGRLKINRTDPEQFLLRITDAKLGNAD
jgi:tetratricopeptide (TPR) repeat protein